ncbi:MAG: hypothetical protein HYV63_32490 [Candidatus Schekmanbacteria bacterium]|nr:hypothetical protein [Candidatus Schekmanbacteria bacterium]
MFRTDMPTEKPALPTLPLSPLTAPATSTDTPPAAPAVGAPELGYTDWQDTSSGKDVQRMLAARHGNPAALAAVLGCRGEIEAPIDSSAGMFACQDLSEPAAPAAPAPQLTVKGVIAAGGELSANTILAVNEAAQQVGDQPRRYVAYDDVVKVGGSLAWRANNPGNLRNASTKIATVPGAVGSFAVFASMEAGRQAQKDLYLNNYGDKSVREAVAELTPPSENNTAAYLEELASQGIKLDETVRSQIEPLMEAIKNSEGMIAGTEARRVP